MAKTPRLLIANFHENFEILESHENWYIDALGQAEHESGISFLITRTSNAISPNVAK